MRVRLLPRMEPRQLIAYVLIAVIISVPVVIAILIKRGRKAEDRRRI